MERSLNDSAFYKMNSKSNLINSTFSAQSTLLSDLLRTVLCKRANCRFQVKGHSMSPFIKDGDMVTISLLTRKSLSIGYVKGFDHPETGKLAIYRIVWKRGDSYLVRGENAIEVDSLIKKEIS